MSGKMQFEINCVKVDLDKKQKLYKLYLERR